MSKINKQCPVVTRWLEYTRGWFPRHLTGEIDQLLDASGEIETCSEENSNTIHAMTANILSDMFRYIGLNLNAELVKINLDHGVFHRLSSGLIKQSWAHAKYNPYIPNHQSVMTHAANSMHHFTIATRSLHVDPMTMAESCSCAYREAKDAIWETKADNFMYRAADKLFEPVKRAVWLMVVSGQGER